MLVSSLLSNFLSQLRVLLEEMIKSIKSYENIGKNMILLKEIVMKKSERLKNILNVVG